MWKLMVHELKNYDLIKDTGKMIASSVRSVKFVVLLLTMNFFRFSILLSLGFFLAVAYAKDLIEDVNDVFESQPNVKHQRDISDYILQRNNEGRLRRRRDDESARHRRNGNGNGHGHEGITGPVHTFVKTDEHAHFKWGVRHHVGHEYAGRR